MTLFELLCQVQTLGPRSDQTLTPVETDLKKQQALFQSAYSQIIEILNYVFPHITEDNFTLENDRKIPEKKRTMSLEERSEWFSLALKELCTDQHSFKVMYRYVLLMHVLHGESRISEFYDVLSKMLDSFDRTFPPYLSQPCPNYLYFQDDTPLERPNKRKTNDNKRETLRQKYLDIISLIKTSENIILLETGIRAETEMDALLLCPNMDKAKVTELMNSNRFYTLDKKYRAVYQKYTGYIEKATDQYYEYLTYEHDHIDVFQENEVNLIKYLYKIYLQNLRKSPIVDIRDKKNQNNWNILTEEERAKLLQYVDELNDENQTYLKYMGPIMEEREYNYSKLLESLSGNHMFETQKLAYEILQMCQNISAYPQNKCGPDYKMMVYRIQLAHKACCSVELFLNDNIDKDFSEHWLEEFESALQERANPPQEKSTSEQA